MQSVFVALGGLFVLGMNSYMAIRIYKGKHKVS